MMRRLRIALYSHDAMGLGHMRRNLLLADTLRRFPARANVLLISGARETSAFAIPPGVDCITLPSFRKQPGSGYVPRTLNVTAAELVKLRSRIIRSAIEAFDPDLFIVDKLPRGLLHELDPSIAYIAARRTTRLVLGLRDVLDEPEVVRREWAESGTQDAIRAFYDAVWVYGDRAVYDPLHEYNMPAELAARTRFTGYLDPRARAGTTASAGSDATATLTFPAGPLVLCQMGGGQDGARVAEAFARATLPADAHGVIVTGPYMPAESRHKLTQLTEQGGRVRIIEFTAAPEVLLRRADSVVTMGGYNSVCEVLSHEKRALIVPRIAPRREQLIRAERLRDLGVVDVLHPDDATVDALQTWLSRADSPRASVLDKVDFHGLHRLPRLVEEVLSSARIRDGGLRLSA